MPDEKEPPQFKHGESRRRQEKPRQSPLPAQAPLEGPLPPLEDEVGKLMREALVRKYKEMFAESESRPKIDRDRLLGLAAMLNVVQAELDRHREHKVAANHVNAAVVAIHESAAWDANELERMGALQNWLVEQLGATD